MPGTLSPVYVALCESAGDFFTLKGNKNIPNIIVSSAELNLYVAESVYVPWKNYYEYRGVIPVNAPKDTIISLKLHLRDIGYDDVEISPFYDENTRKAVMEIQNKHGLSEDGLVGPLTKIVLYNEIEALNTPKIGSDHSNKVLN